MTARAREHVPARVDVRAAAPRDIERIAAIEAAAFSQPWSRESFAELVVTPFARMFVAVHEPDTVVGYAVIYLAADESELANLAVAPSYRGRGVGRRLLRAAMSEAATRGAQSMYLEVRASNFAAQSLYGSAGFVAVGRRQRYYQQPVEDALVLRAPLPGGSAGGRPVTG